MRKFTWIVTALMSLMSIAGTALADTDLSSLILSCNPSRSETSADFRSMKNYSFCNLYTNTGSVYSSGEVLTDSEWAHILYAAGKAYQGEVLKSTFTYCQVDGVITSSLHTVTSNRYTLQSNKLLSETTTTYCTGACTPSYFKERICNGQNSITTKIVY